MKNLLLILFTILFFSLNSYSQYPVNRSGVSVVDGGGILPWEANGKAYDINDIVFVNDRIYAVNTLHVSTAVFTDDISNWDELSEGGITRWTTGLVYNLEQIVYDELTGLIYRCTTTHTAGATFAADIANWTQLSGVNFDAGVTGVLPVANGGTNSSTALVDNYVMQSSGGAIVESVVGIDGLGNINTAGDIKVGEGTSLEFDLILSLYRARMTGVAEPNGLTIDVGNTTFGINPTQGQIVDFDAQTYDVVNYAGSTGNAPATANGVTYVYLDALGAVSTTTTLPTPAERREKLYLGRVVTVGGIIVQELDEPVVTENAAGSIYDLAKAIRIFNEEGNLITANGANLNLNKSNGKVFSVGANYTTDRNNPHRVDVPACTLCTFAYITQAAGSTQANTTLIDPANYDVGGTITPVAGANKTATIQRLYLFPSGSIRVAYGQETYVDLPTALQNLSSQNFVDNPAVFGNGVLFAIIAVRKDATDLTDMNQARILYPSRFGESAVGAAGQSVSSLQNAYDNSDDGQIVLNPSPDQGSFEVRDNANPIGTPLLEVLSNDELSTYFSVSPTLNTSVSLDITGRLEVASTTEPSLPCPVMSEADKILTTPIAGDCIFNSDSGALQYYDGIVWNDLKSLGLPVLNTGSLLTSNGISNGELAVGTDGQFLVANSASADGTGLEWQTVALSPTTTEGDLIIRGALVDERLPIGTADQILISNGTTATWEDAPASAGGGINFIADGNFEASTYNPTSNPVITPTYPLFVAGDELASESNKVYWQGAYTIGVSTDFYIRDTIARTGLQGEQGLFGVWIANNAADTTKLTLCLRTDDAAFAGACDERLTIENLKNDGELHYYEIPFVFGTASVEYEIFHPAIAADITVKLDQIFLGVAADVTKNINTITDREDYTPVFQGFGEVTNIDFKWMRVGESIIIDGYFTAGTPTATEVQIGLPSGLLISNKATQIRSVGMAIRSATSSENWHLLATAGDSFLNMGHTVVGAGLSPILGTQTVGAGQSMSFTAVVPIQGWSSGLNGIVQNNQLDAKSANEFSALISSVGTVSNENYDWINGNCTKGGDGIYNCSFNTSLFTQPPNCQITRSVSSATAVGIIGQVLTSATNADISMYRDDRVRSDTDFYINCSKQGADVNKSQTIVGTFKSINSSDLIQVEAAGNNSSSVTADVTPVNFTEVKDLSGSWDGFTFSPSKNGRYFFSGKMNSTTASTYYPRVWVSRNGAAYAVEKSAGTTSVTGTAKNFNFTLDLTSNDTVQIRSTNTLTLSNVADFHYLSITQSADYEAIVKNLYADNVTECETKFLQANSVSIGTLTDLTFSNLLVGKKYRSILHGNTESGAYVQMVHDSIIKSQLFTGSTALSATSVSKCFEATDTSFVANQVTTGRLNGTAAENGTWLELCKLPDTTICN